MDLFQVKRTKRDGPEAAIQRAIVVMLKARDWGVIETHGSQYQFGLPDLYAMHARYGTRWVETKNPEKYSFTPGQMEIFPLMTSKGVGIWILTAATEEEYQKLFKPPNWFQFLSIMRP